MAARTLTIIDLCAGTGMLSEGVGLALRSVGVGAETVCYLEREASAAASLVARMEAETLPDALVWDDLSTFDGRPFRGAVDCVVAGYPCQPFSSAGRRRGSRDPRHLWPEVRRIVAEIQPGIVFLENVAGHLRLGFPEVCDELRAMGYHVTPGLFSSAECGANHQRKRLFILGVADAEGLDVDLHARQRGDRERAAVTADGSRTVAHSGRLDGREPAPSGGNGDRADAQPASAALAHASHRGERERLRKPSTAGDGCEPGAEGFGEDVGQARSDERGPGQGPQGDQGRPGAGAGRGNLPRYAPARNDWGAWAAVAELDPARMPAIESGVCRVADGLVPRSERLRLVGNGVDPLVAGYAFLTLLACAASQ